MLRSLLVAGAAGAAWWLARTAWRQPVHSRLRFVRARPSRRLPERVRAPLRRALGDAGLGVSPEEAVGIVVAAVVGAAAIAGAFHPALAVPAGVGVALVCPLALGVARGRGVRRYEAALPSFVESVAARLRSGHTVATALAEAGERDGALAADVRGVLARVDLGDALVDALWWWAGERRLDAVRAVAGSLAVAAQTGGAAASALDGLARSLRDQLGARAEATALSAQARLSAVVVGGAPVAYLLFSSAVDPGTVTNLVGTGSGRVCLGLGLGLDALGATWMWRIVRSTP